MDQMVLETQKWLNNTYNGIEGFEPFTDNELDGVTGRGTFKRLIEALQIEANKQYGASLVVDGDFGKGTLEALPDIVSVFGVKNNIHYIIQGSLWCKGYPAGTLDGIYGEASQKGVKEFQSDAGIANDGIVRPYILQGIMNTDGYKYIGNVGTNEYYKHLVQLGMNTNYGNKVGLTAPNGEWERKSHQNYIKCCQIEWGCTPVDGIWGTGTMNSAPTLSQSTSGYSNSKRLLTWGLTINGFYPGHLTGVFDNQVYNAVYKFQDFLRLGADGIAGKNTWASLLSSRGNTARPATACDTSTRLTAETAKGLKAAGYRDIGRYLTNAKTGNFDKKMTSEELEIIEAAGLRVFPIYQTYGGEASYFNRYQGQKDGEEAKKAAREFGFPPSATIYFAVDYDALMDDIASHIIPYFQGINEVITGCFHPGVYGPRAVCNRLKVYGLAEKSFVANMSSGFTGNIGQIMPSNWAYDQFYETTAAGIGIDKNIASPICTAISPADFVSYDIPSEPEISQNFQVFKKIYDLAWEFLESISMPTVGIYPSVFNANAMALQYLRTSGYSNSSSRLNLSGIAWDFIAGPRDPEFVKLVEKTYSDIVPEDISIIDPLTGTSISFPHYAATLNACIVGTAGLNFEFLERDVDAFSGWAGDLMQMAAVLQISADMGYNYFNISDLQNIIGAPPLSLQDYHLFFKNANGDIVEMETKDAGFSREDFYQDIDAYNISRIYDLSSVKLHIALNDYYNISKHYKKRFSIFKKKLLEQYEGKTLYQIIAKFSKEDLGPLSKFFEHAFGNFNSDIYGEILAQAYEEKISVLAEAL